jgi:hypothetical protein
MFMIIQIDFRVRHMLFFVEYTIQNSVSHGQWTLYMLLVL